MKIEDLEVGMLVRHRGNSYTEKYVVTANYGSRATGVRTIDITSFDEWEVVSETAETPAMSVAATASMTLDQAIEIDDLRERVARLEQELKIQKSTPARRDR